MRSLFASPLRLFPTHRAVCHLRRCSPKTNTLSRTNKAFASLARDPSARAIENAPEHAYDVIVVGSGCSGLTAAVVAAKKGLRVLVTEKTDYYGGTTAYSGGGAWIPCNKHQATLGVHDSPEEARKYLRQFVGDGENGKVDAFIDSGPKMVEWLEDNTLVKFKGVPLPDYHPTKAGATVGRTMLTQAFDGSRLGRQIKEIRYTLKGFTAFGSMQAEPGELAALTAPFRSVSNFSYTFRKLLGYALDLLRYGKGTHMTNGNALVGQLFASARDAGVEFWRNSPATSALLRAEGGVGVDGLVIDRNGQPTRVQARLGVVLASGGLGRSPRSQQVVPHEWSVAPRGNQGDGISIAEQVGAQTSPRNKSNAIFAPISLLHRADGTVWRFPHFALDRAKPGSIIVGPDGKRFANESEPYQEFVSTMHKQGIKKAFFLGDRRFLHKYGMGMALPAPYPIGDLLRRGYLIRGRTLDELARKMEVDPATLKETVNRCNKAALDGRDQDFNRGETTYDQFYGDPSVTPNASLATFSQGPFYALPLIPGNVSVMWGLSTDKDAQVLNRANNPILGLYAVGCDQNSVMLGEYPGGGSSIGPGMTFGFRAAEHLASQS